MAELMDILVSTNYILCFQPDPIKVGETLEGLSDFGPKLSVAFHFKGVSHG